MYSSRQIIFYITGIVLFGVFVFLFGFKINHEPLELNYKASKGIMDFTNENFGKKRFAVLMGEWEFYWQCLLTSDDFKNNQDLIPCYVELPGVWNNIECNNIQTTAKGYATYRLKVLLSEGGYYGIRIKELDCAYRLWVNGVHLVETGKIGLNKEEEIPDWRRKELFFFADTTELEIILQVSNFNHRKGGAEDPIIFSKGQEIYNYKLVQIAVAYFLLGFFVLMVLNYLVLYFYRRQDKSLVLFAFMNLLIALRLGTVGEKILLDIFPNLSWGLAIRIEYLSYTLALPVIYAFFDKLFPGYFSQVLQKVINTCAGLVTVVILFSPAALFSFTPIFYQIVVAIAASYVLFVMIKVAFAKIENAAVVLGGYVFFFIGTVNDILYYNSAIETSFLMPFGLFVMIFTQAFVLSKNNSNAYIKSEQLSQQLEEYNRNLEDKVKNRTHEIEKQKREIEEKSQRLEETNSKLKQLNLFLRDMTSMIVHDLKSPLSVIIGLDLVPGDKERANTVKQSGYKMLNLIQNILDVFKYQNNRIDLKPENLQLLSVVKSAINDQRFVAGLKELKFCHDIDKQCIVFADAEITGRILANLLSNAIKFSSHGGTIQIKAKVDLNGDYRISIINDGPAVPKEKQQDIFRKFGQAEKRSQAKATSSGLGLTFCKMAVEAQGGTIGLISEYEFGVEFWFTLPNPQKPKTNVSVDKIIFTSQEQKLIQPIIKQLNELNIYEVSAIRKILAQLKDKTTNIENWRQQVEDAVFSSDSELFNGLVSIDIST